MNSKDQATIDRLSKLSGAEFDREYIRQQVKDHEKTISLFEHQASKGKDGELKAWAAKTLPTLRDHERQARELSSTAKSGGKGTSADTNTGSGTPRRP